MHHRQTTDNIRRILHILGQIQNDKTQVIVGSLDAEKAFDSVRWEFLYKVLGKFGFQDRFIRVIQAWYDRPSACIKVNGDLSEAFILKSECRQGCAISPLLFNLFIEELVRSAHIWCFSCLTCIHIAWEERILSADLLYTQWQSDTMLAYVRIPIKWITFTDCLKRKKRLCFVQADVWVW